MAEETGLSRGAVGDFLAARFGGIFTDRSNTVSAGLAVVQLCGFDSERVALTIINLGAAEVFVAPRSNPSSGLGIRLNPNGGGVTVNVLEDGVLCALAWHALAAGAANNVYVMEVVREVII